MKSIELSNGDLKFLRRMHIAVDDAERTIQTLTWKDEPAQIERLRVQVIAANERLATECAAHEETRRQLASANRTLRAVNILAGLVVLCLVVRLYFEFTR